MRFTLYAIPVDPFARKEDSLHVYQGLSAVRFPAPLVQLQLRSHFERRVAVDSAVAKAILAARSSYSADRVTP